MWSALGSPNSSHCVYSHRCSLLLYCMCFNHSANLLCPERESGRLFLSVQGDRAPLQVINIMLKGEDR